MTPKSSAYVDLQEIPAIDITCNHCGSIIRLPLPKIDLNNSVHCVGCNTQLWFDKSTHFANLLLLLQALSDYKRIAGDAKFTVGFSLPYVPASGDRVA